MQLSELKDVAEVERLALRPGDVVVIKVPWQITNENAVSLIEHARGLFPEGTQVAVLDGGMDIAVLRPEETAA